MLGCWGFLVRIVCTLCAWCWLPLCWAGCPVLVVGPCGFFVVGFVSEPVVVSDGCVVECGFHVGVSSQVVGGVMV